jgi:uncharacterized membrane protein
VSGPGGSGNGDERLLRRVRVAAAVLVSISVVFLVAADVLGRLFIRPDFHASEVMLATMVGALIALLGLEGIARLGKGGSQ